ncbi:MAG: YbaN family protein [Anaerotignaceae bacterium]
MKPMIILKLVIGFLSLCIGAVGIFLPVLPTTPFVLLSVGCFSSHPTIKNKVLKIPFMLEYYESYNKGNSLKIKTLVTSMTFLWVMLIISMFAVAKIHMSIFLIIIGVAVSVHLIYLTKKRKK